MASLNMLRGIHEFTKEKWGGIYGGNGAFIVLNQLYLERPRKVAGVVRRHNALVIAKVKS